MIDTETRPVVGRVADLVNPYLTPAPGQEGGNRARVTGGRDIGAWLEANPGRWALVFENGMGTSADIIKKLGYVASSKGRDLRTMKVYAQNPHPGAETLTEALARTDRRLYLPKLERDPFNWTPAELADACQVARDNLFPVDGRWSRTTKPTRRKE
ncbi:MAG TPA: hypothetical protein VF867_17830 [Arthrobacter sp.]